MKLNSYKKIVYVVFATLQLFSNHVLAEATVNDVSYNHNALCLFNDFMNSKLPKLNKLLLSDTTHAKKVLKKSNKPATEYVYQSNGITVNFFQKNTSVVTSKSQFQANLLSEHMRSLKYLIAILEIKNTDHSASPISLECDAEKTLFYFKEDTLSKVEILPSFVD